MRKFKETEPTLFQKYATVDSVVSLHHALMVEYTSLTNTGRLGVPLTISSLAGKILEKGLLTSEYSLPTRNGKYNTKNLSKIYTPKGINLSGGLGD